MARAEKVRNSEKGTNGKVENSSFVFCVFSISCHWSHEAKRLRVAIAMFSQCHFLSHSPIPNTTFRLRAMAPHSTPLELNRFAEVGNKVADAAGEVIRKYFRKNFDVIHKHDLSNFILHFLFIFFLFLCFYLMLHCRSSNHCWSIGWGGYGFNHTRQFPFSCYVIII